MADGNTIYAARMAQQRIKEKAKRKLAEIFNETEGSFDKIPFCILDGVFQGNFVPLEFIRDTEYDYHYIYDIVKPGSYVNFLSNQYITVDGVKYLINEEMCDTESIIEICNNIGAISRIID